jgi:hypothetical protein
MADHKDESEQIAVEVISAKINRIIPENLEPHFVNDMIIQHHADFFILSFFQYIPPAIIAETDEERLQMAKSIETVDSKCVSRLILTPGNMRRFLEVMSENMAKYDKKTKKSEITEE